MYNLIAYSGNCSQASRSLRQYCGKVPAVDNSDAFTEFTEANVTTI